MAQGKTIFLSLLLYEVFFRALPTTNETIVAPITPEVRGSVPPTWDIRSQGPGKLNAVRDQGSCSGCWAFATSASLENGWSIKTGNLVTLSEQQQIDCNKDCYGCNGGFIQRSFKYPMVNGLTDVPSYPFTGENGACKGGLSNVASNKGFILLPSDTASIKAYISANGACAVCVDGTHWWDYYSGIYNGAGTKIQCNHAVTLIGYGDGYWLIRNSWSADWGEQGYIRVEDSTAGGIFKNMVYCPTF